ncbi:MAG: EpsG family protein [Clostridia bacterium]|nr:EpsG family protein [Clostridia bacterium]
MVFWIMLIWIMAAAYFLQPTMAVPKLTADGEYDYQGSFKYGLLLFSVPLFFIALRSGFIDTGSYIGDFDKTPVDMALFSTYIHTNDRSYFFHALQMLFKIYISDNAQVWIAVIAVIQTLLVMWTFCRYSCDPGYTVFLFMASGIVCSWMCNGIRQFLTVAIIFACTQWLIDKKWWFYLPVVLLMMGLLPITSRLGLPEPPWYLCGVHQAALIMLLSCFFIQGKAFNVRVYVLAGAFAVLVLSGGLDALLENSVEDTAYEKELEYVAADTGTSWVRVFVEAVPCVMAFLAKRKIEEEGAPPIIQLSINASIVTTVLYVASAFTSGTFVGRLPIYTEMYNFILLPWLLRHPYRQYKQILPIAVVVAYLAYFFYQVSISWATVPYQSEVLGINVE